MPREQVKWFADQMELKLKENDHKGDWDGCSIDYLIQRLYEEFTELFAIIHTNDKELIISECADVSNFAMMIADKFKNCY